MIDYAIYNSQGKFISAGSAEFVDENSLESGHGIYYGSVDIFTDYFDLDIQAVVQKTPQPSSNHEFDYATKTWVLNPAQAQQQVLSQRQRLLEETDWTDTVSAQIRLGSMYEVWQAYRQALRDITSQAGYPTAVEWPTRP